MENFIYHNPTKVMFGAGTIANIGREIQKFGLKKILMLAGSGSIKNNTVYEQVTKSLKRAGIEWLEHWGVRPNPVLDHALEGIEIVRKNNPEAILAIGGGSVNDEGKSIAAGIYLDNLWDAFERTATINRALPLFTVLTLSGTGSEMNSFAVLSNEAEKKKWNIGSIHLNPKVSIIDPAVQMSLPWHQTVNGAIDSMSHIMEFYFLGTNEEISISIDEAMMKTIILSVDKLLKDENDYNARANLAWAATLGLNGISGIALKGGDWASHRIEHGISALHPEVAHGAGLGVVFPALIKYQQRHNQAQFERWARIIWDASSVEEAVALMKLKFQSWNATVSLRELGIASEEISEIAENSLKNGGIGVLSDLNTNDIENILKLAY